MLERRGAQVHLNTTVTSAEDGHVVLSDGSEFDSELIVWTTGNAATRLMPQPHRSAAYRAGPDPGLRRSPGRHRDNLVTDAWAAGDDAAVPDLASSTEGAFTVPNAQNAVRQGKLLAKNLVRSLRVGSRRSTCITA